MTDDIQVIYISLALIFGILTLLSFIVDFSTSLLDIVDKTAQLESIPIAISVAPMKAAPPPPPPPPMVTFNTTIKIKRKKREQENTAPTAALMEELSKRAGIQRPVFQSPLKGGKPGIQKQLETVQLRKIDVNRSPGGSIVNKKREETDLIGLLLRKQFAKAYAERS